MASMRQRTTQTTKKVEQQGDVDDTANLKTLLKEVDALLAATEPLDTDEQERAVELFEEAQLREARLWKSVFGAGAIMLGAFLFYALVHQIKHPFSVRYTGEFKAVTSNQELQAVLLLQACSLMLTASGLVRSRPPKGERERGCLPPSLRHRMFVWLGLLGTCSGCLFWSLKLVAVAKHRQEGIMWSLAWLPLGPMVTSALCLHVLNMMDATARQVNALKDLKYEHKKV